MKNNKYNSIFDGITDSEFEEMLKECRFEYKKVEQGKGGLFISNNKSKKIKSEVNER